MKKTLGLDLGTSSIGWAIIEQEGGVKKLAAAGSVIFPEGVARVKGNETPATEQRTRNRATRRLYMRRRMRKQRLLLHLIKNGMCPLSQEGLKNWKAKDRYPLEEAFITWFKLNPYELRAKGLVEKLAPMELGRILYHMAQRRGFQSNRKGGDGEQESFHEGLEDKGIAGYNDTKRLIEEHGTLGKAGYELGKDHIAIRKRYFKRSNLVDEFSQLWDVQKNFHPILTDALKAELGDVKSGDLFFQRPLKGKKSDVGRCTLEPGKKRAPISSIEAELFGVLHTVNNIKMDGRPLNEAERRKVLPKFFRKSSATFPFEDIRSALKEKGVEHSFNYDRADIRSKQDGKHVKLTGAQTIAHLADMWGVDPLMIVDAFGTMAPDQEPERKQWEDRWSVIYNATEWAEISESKEKGQYVRSAGAKRDKRDLKEYAKTVWGFNDEQLEVLKKFDTKQGYHNLSSRALGRIIPLLYMGIPYHYAVLYANLPTVFKVVHKAADGKTVTSIDDRWTKMTDNEREAVYQGIHAQVAGHRQYNVEMLLLNGLIRHYRDTYGEEGMRKGFWNADWDARLERAINETLSLDQKRSKGAGELAKLHEDVKKEFIRNIESHQKVQFEELFRMDARVKNWLQANYDLEPKALEKLYHHSAIDIYKNRQGDRLGDPKTPGLKNPMVYRALHSLRMVVNKMIDAKLIDRKTQVNIEMARELDSANKRKAWERYQRVMEAANRKAEEMVKEHYKETGRTGNPTDPEIFKAWLYLEADELWKPAKCAYTGKVIGGVHQLFESGDWEVDHIWPQSKTVDNSKANMVLCYKRYNADVKKDQLPSQLPNFKDERLLGAIPCASISRMAEAVREKLEKYERTVYACKMSSKTAATKEAKDKAIQDRWFNQFFRDYWRTKYEHLTAEEIRPGFMNRQLVATGQITKLARAYMNSYFNRVECLKPEALTAFRKEWMGESFVHEKDRSKHTHHAVDAVVCAAVDRTAFNALAHHYEEHDEKNVAGSFDHPWDSFGSDMRKLRDAAHVYHVRKPSIGRTSVYDRKVKLKDGSIKPIKATGDAVRGTLHGATYYGRVKRKKPGTEEYEVKTVIRKTLDHSSFYPFKEADKAKVVDKRIKDLLEHADLEKIKADGGLEVRVKNGDGFTIQKIKKVRVFEPSVKNPKALKAHRDALPVAEHKHHLWVTGGENPVLAMYQNSKGRGAHRVFSLFDLAEYMKGKRGRSKILDAIPTEHPERPGFQLAMRNGKPFVLHVGQLVVLYKDDPEEVVAENGAEMNRRTYVLRKVEDDPRVNLVNVLDARPDKEIEESSEWDINDPFKWLRFSPHGIKAMFDGIDVDLAPIPRTEFQMT